MDDFMVRSKAVKLYSLVAPNMEQMQKVQRYSIGIKFEHTCLNLLERIIEGENSPRVIRQGVVTQVIVNAEIAKVQLRLLMDRHLVQEANYFTWAELLQEIVKMAQGWKTSLIAKP